MFAEQEMIHNSYLYLFVYKLLSGVLANLRVIDKGILPLEKNSVAILFYFDVENVDHLSSCRMKSWMKRCCLMGEKTDCDAMDVYGGDDGILKPGNQATLLYVYPTLCQHDQQGYCDFVLDYQCGTRRRLRRQEVHTPFDTRLSADVSMFIGNYLSGREIVECDSIDQDSLNECAPVDCDTKYSGNKPFFNIVVQKCVPVPTCETDTSKELPNWVYEPQSNTCRDLDTPLTMTDLYGLSSGLEVVTELPKSKDALTMRIKSNLSSISQNLSFLENVLFGKVTVENIDTSDYSRFCRSAILSIILCILGLSSVLLGFVCIVITATCVYKKLRSGSFKELFQRKKSSRNKSKPNVKESKSRIDKEGSRKHSQPKKSNQNEFVKREEESHPVVNNSEEDSRNHSKPDANQTMHKVEKDEEHEEHEEESDPQVNNSEEASDEYIFTESETHTDTEETGSDDKRESGHSKCSCRKCCKECIYSRESTLSKGSSSGSKVPQQRWRRTTKAMHGNLYCGRDAS